MYVIVGILQILKRDFSLAGIYFGLAYILLNMKTEK